MFRRERGEMALHQSSLSLIGKSSFMPSPGGFKIELDFTNFFQGSEYLGMGC